MSGHAGKGNGARVSIWFFSENLPCCTVKNCFWISWQEMSLRGCTDRIPLWFVSVLNSFIEIDRSHLGLCSGSAVFSPKCL